MFHWGSALGQDGQGAGTRWPPGPAACSQPEPRPRAGASGSERSPGTAAPLISREQDTAPVAGNRRASCLWASWWAGQSPALAPGCSPASFCFCFVLSWRAASGGFPQENHASRPLATQTLSPCNPLSTQTLLHADPDPCSPPALRGIASRGLGGAGQDELTVPCGATEPPRLWHRGSRSQRVDFAALLQTNEQVHLVR